MSLSLKMKLKLSRHCRLVPLLTITVVMVVLALLRIQFKSGPKSSNLLFDGNSQSEYNCSEILHGNVEEIEKTKLLLSSTDFRQKVLHPDDHYIKAAQDCKCVARFIGFVAPKALDADRNLAFVQESFNLLRCLLNIVCLQCI